MEWILRTDEEKQAVSSLEMAVEQLGKIPQDPYRWEWAVISLHNALQAFLVLTIGKTDFTRVMRDKTARKFLIAASDDTVPFPDTDLKSMVTLYKKFQTPIACCYVHSQQYIPTGTQPESVDKLNYWRNKFIHFVPAGAVLGLLEFPPMTKDIIDIISFIVKKSGSFFWNENELHQKALALLNEAEEAVRLLEEEAGQHIRKQSDSSREPDKVGL